jgi:hypothetical protein
VLEELFEVYRGYFLKALNFGQNAVNPCVKSFNVVAHGGLAHANASRFALALNLNVSLRQEAASSLVRMPRISSWDIPALR